MPYPFLITNDFEAVKTGLTKDTVEGVIWKGAVDPNVIQSVTEFDFNRVESLRGKGFQRGRDLWKKETVIYAWVSDFYDELACLDKHITQVRSFLREITGPIKARGDLKPCHYVSSNPLILSSQVPHIDTFPDSKIIRGQLGSVWKTVANPKHYPAFKVIAALNTDSQTSTTLIPSKDRGEEDPNVPNHFPEADISNAVSAEPGDITILKQYVTVHCGPENVERRWFTIY